MGENESNTSSGDTTNDENSDSTESKTKVQYTAGDLQVKAETTEDFETVSSVLEEQIDEMMKMRMVGEYEVIEEEELHSVILGGE